MLHTLTPFKGNSWRECFFWNLEKKIARANSTSSLFFFPSKVSNWELSVPRMLVLKLSSKFPSSALVTHVPFDLLILEIMSREFFPYLELLREYHLQKSQISSYVNRIVSPAPMMFNVSIQSSSIPLWKRIHKVYHSKLFCFVLCKLYWNFYK